MSGGTYECFHCLCNSVVWDADFDFEDFGYEGQGIVHIAIAQIAERKSSIEYR